MDAEKVRHCKGYCTQEKVTFGTVYWGRKYHMN